MSTRKDFIAVSSLFALAPQIAVAASPAPLRFDFDQARFNDMLAKPAKHRQCFGATKIDGGGVIEGMNNTINAYEQYLGETPGSVHTAAVLYHGAAIALALNNAVWNDLLLPTVKTMPPDIRTQFDGAKPGHGNPYLREVTKIVGRGASFFVCHNAVAGFAQLTAGALKQPVEKVHAAIMAGVLPGALVVPAGVMAINACQEAKFTYIQSSL